MSIAIMNAVWKTSKQKGNALLTLLAIADIADEDGKAWPGIKFLADKVRISERQIQRLLPQIVASGELHIAKGGGRRNTNLYTVVLRKDDKLSPFSVKGDIQGIERVTSGAIKGDIAMSPDSYLHLSRHGSKAPERKSRKVTSLDELVVDDELRERGRIECPNVDADWALKEFVAFCEAEERTYKNYRAAFWKSMLRQQGWWEERNPAASAGNGAGVSYDGFRPDNSPAREAFRVAHREWKEGGSQGDEPKIEAFEHFNQPGITGDG